VIIRKRRRKGEEAAVAEVATSIIVRTALTWIKPADPVGIVYNIFSLYCLFNKV